MQDSTIEILVEERSMKLLLEGLLPRILPAARFQLNVNVFIRPHEGRSDLLKSIPNKLKGYQAEHRNRRLLVMILVDQDSNDCLKLKQAIQSRIQEASPLPSTWQYRIRIPCRELENWYLGDLPALAAAIGGFQAGNSAEQGEVPGGHGRYTQRLR